MFKLFENIYIHEFCNFYSDVHCPITFELISRYHDIETRPTVQPRDENNTRQYIWDPEKTEQYKQSIDTDKLNELQTEI